MTRPLATTILCLSLAVWGCAVDSGPVCNGSPALCSRPFDQVAFPTTHNAMSSAEDKWILPNQHHAIGRQLEDGVRGLMLDIHDYQGEVYLCHEYCSFGRTRLVDGLGRIQSFMEQHPAEVVTIIFESYVSAADAAAVFEQSGLRELAHAQTRGEPWPTLQQMIDSGRRLVVLTDREGGAFPWYHDIWSLAWETPYAAKSAEDFVCDANRGSRENDLFILNHFLTDPVALPELAQKVNFNPLFIDRARQCQTESGRLPNFVTVDFYSDGDLFGVVRELNGLPGEDHEL